MEGLYLKIKEQYTDKLANVIMQKGKGDEVKAFLGEYFIEGLEDTDAETNRGDASKNVTPRDELVLGA